MEPRLIRLHIKPWHYRTLKEANVKGGHKTHQTHLMQQMRPVEDGYEIVFAEDAPGPLFELLRQMGYGGGEGGWQKKLRDAFLPAILKYVGANL